MFCLNKMVNYIQIVIICMVVTCIAMSSAGEYVKDNDGPADVTNEGVKFDAQYVSYLHSLVDAYKEIRTMTEYEPPMDTKYRAWKRNADLINSMLAMPKEMSDAGR